MLEFLKDCVHELKDLDMKNIDSAYIKELEVKIEANLAKTRRGEKSIIEIRNVIEPEEIHVMGLLFRIDSEIKDYAKEMNEPQEWPTYEHIPEKDIVEKAVYGTIRHPHFEYTGTETKSLNITLEEAMKTHADAFRVPYFMEYLEFLGKVNEEIKLALDEPEYWKMRREGNPKPVPGSINSENVDIEKTHMDNSTEKELYVKEIKFVKYIKDSGQIEINKAENGKYNLIDKAENFVHWYIYNNYQELENYRFLPIWIDKYLNHYCTLETLKRYVRQAKKIVPEQLKSIKHNENLKELR